jgi:hypothetical protein
MALEKSTKQDKIEIVDAGDWKNIQVRAATVIKEDGVEISRSFHRHVVDPNSDLTNESDEVKKLAEIYFTDDAKAKHKAAMEATAGPA